MFSHRLYAKIVTNILLILVISGSGIGLIVSGQAIIIGTLLIIWAILQIRHLVNLLNNSNRRITLFFDAIQDSEFQGHFPEQGVDREERLLNRTFNRIRELISQNRQQSQKQEIFYKTLLEHNPSGLLAWESQGKILLVNQAALHLLGFSILNHTRQITERYPEFRQIAGPQENRRSYDLRIHTEQGIRQLAAVRNDMILQGQQVTLLSLQDIREQLDEKESESWNRLTHILTHEIMNTIAPITSLSETLLSYFESNGTIRNRDEISEQVIQKTGKGLTIIRRQGKSLLHFAESYRKLSFIPIPVLSPFRFSQLAEHLQQLFQTELETHSTKLETDTIPPNLIITADEEQLSQVLINLIRNAIQACEGCPGATIRLTARPTDQGFLLQVRDNGKGIPPELLQNIFVPFFTTKKSGSGIGLSLSRQIIRLHGGDLTVTSQPGQETCFSIILPIHDRENREK